MVANNRKKRLFLIVWHRSAKYLPIYILYMCIFYYVCTFNRHHLSLLRNNSFTATAKAEFLQCVVIGSTEKKFYFLASDRRRHNVHIMTRIIHSAAPQPVKISTFYSPRCVLCNFFSPVLLFTRPQIQINIPRQS